MLAQNCKNILKDLEADVDAINQALVANLQTHVPFISEVGRHILLSGGKRVRPLLFLLSARLCGCRGDQLTDFSTIFEYLHAATLLHDDVVDAATVRRGITTANTVWGNQAVILVGDFLLAKSLSLAVDTDKLKVLKVLANTTTCMAEGEILQLLHARNLDLTREQYFEVTLRKTAALMSAACQIGAILAGVSAPQEDALTQFGLNLGITFQVVDDILDFTGDVATAGETRDQRLEGRAHHPAHHPRPGQRRRGRAPPLKRTGRQCQAGDRPGNPGHPSPDRLPGLRPGAGPPLHPEGPGEPAVFSGIH